MSSRALCTGSAALRRRFKAKRKKQRDDKIAAAMAEAAARSDRDEARLEQSLMLEALFETFFRVIKQCTASGLLQGEGSGDKHSKEAAGNGIIVAELSAEKMAKKFPLLYVALEGLAKYTHLISVDYFTDLMTVRIPSCMMLIGIQVTHMQADMIAAHSTTYHLLPLKAYTGPGLKRPSVQRVHLPFLRINPT